MMLPTVAASLKNGKEPQTHYDLESYGKTLHLLNIHRVLPFHTYGTLKVSAPRLPVTISYLSQIQTDSLYCGIDSLAT